MGKILVLGAGGMLGHKVCQCLRGHEVYGLVRKAASHYDAFVEVFRNTKMVGGVDVLDERQLDTAIGQLLPDVVINGIGLVKQLQNAEDSDLFAAINTFLPRRLVRLCSGIGARLIHISTDCVFDGRKGSYRETDPPEALDVYGRSKALGETAPEQTSALTLRTSFIGRELEEPKLGLLEWFLSQKGKRVRGFDRVIFSGLTTLELVRVVQRIIDHHPDLSGVFHVAGPAISKYLLLRLIREIFDLEIEIDRVENPVCDRSLLMQAFSARTGYRPPSWHEMIREVFEDPTPYELRSSPMEIQS